MITPRILLGIAALAVASISYGQSAAVVADKTSAAAGSEISLTASATYSGTPAAMGWAVTLPEGWTYVSTAGPDVPAISPQPGATGTIEWAYTDAPAGVAHFRFTVKVAGKAGDSAIKAKLILRSGGKEQSADAPAVVVSVSR